MNDFVVTIGDRKRKIKIIDDNQVIIDGNKMNIELSPVNEHAYLLKVGNKVYDITTQKKDNENYIFTLDGRSFKTAVRTILQEKANDYFTKKAKLTHHEDIKAPMPGLILSVKKKEGDNIEMGESLIILEAMKMENEINAPASGKIKKIFVEIGSSVEKDEIILSIE